MLDSQNRDSDIQLLKFHANRDDNAYLKNAIFNGSFFANSETAIGFLESKKGV